MTTLREEAARRLFGQNAFPQPPIVRVRYPIVLMHGFGILAGLRRQGHLHEEALSLRLRGVLAYAPNVASYNTVAVRAAMWQHRIEHILTETGTDRLNLIAHSMGGLDARYLISTLGLHEVVASLTTISTPHRGTPLAQFMLEQPERLRNWAADLANFMSSAALDDATGDVITALTELTPEHVCETFNAAVPDHASVRYWSYAGAAGKGTPHAVNPVMRLFNGWIYDRAGLNDGFVPVESARWGEFLGTIAADHAQQVGLSVMTGSVFDSNAFYTGIAEHLAAEGF